MPSSGPRSEMLPQFTVHASAYGSTRLQSPWSVSVARNPESILYVVLGTGAWFESPSAGIEPIWCPSGSAISVSFGTAHSWRSDLHVPFGPVEDSFPIASSRMITNVSLTPNGETTILIGRIPLSSLRAFLPVAPVLFVPAEATDTMTRILKTLTRIDIIHSESHQDFSTDAIIQRLWEILVIENTRYWLTTSPDRYAYPIIGMEDRHIYGALTALHRRLDRKWTTDELASEANLSRSAFAVRFKRLTGMAPLEYLTLVRLRKAALMMRDSRTTLAGVALAVGYHSEAAFIRAFRREFNMTPGEYKRRDSKSVLPNAA